MDQGNFTGHGAPNITYDLPKVRRVGDGVLSLLVKQVEQRMAVLALIYSSEH